MTCFLSRGRRNGAISDSATDQEGGDDDKGGGDETVDSLLIDDDGPFKLLEVLTKRPHSSSFEAAAADDDDGGCDDEPLPFIISGVASEGVDMLPNYSSLLLLLWSNQDRLKKILGGTVRRCHDLSSKNLILIPTMKTTSQAALSAVALATAAATVSVYILKKRRKKTYIIAGDIGGTNSRFALHRQGEREPLLVHVYPNESALANTKSYHHATLKPFLEKCAAELEEWSSMVDIMAKVQVVACLATAGPVNTTKNIVYMTNMGKGGQSIDGNAIEECQDGLLSVVIRCKLVNDFVGQGENILSCR